MPIPYPVQKIGRYGLGLGFCYALLHQKFGVDLGERFHKDAEHRLRTLMEIDRHVYETYGHIGLGFEKPFPRISIEPFGHRFIPAMYGQETVFAADSEPCAKGHMMTDERLETLETWTVERFDRAAPVREVVAQTRYLQERHGIAIPTDPAQFNPHYRVLSCVQNLGSVVNQGFALRGEQLFLDYADNPERVLKLYRNIHDLMLLCLRYFPAVDRRPLRNVFVGNCTVAMISPRHYRTCNESFDRNLMGFAQGIGANFLLHQDSGVTPHLENYAQFARVRAIDFGQDTDWEKAAKLFPHADAWCILFPSWIKTHSNEELREEVLRLMRIGKGFKSFSFTLWEIDPFLGEDRIFEFYDTFRQCADELF
ncbi:MAG: hypothetical protein AB1696_26280 [Planctomycetota bacterium]